MLKVLPWSWIPFALGALAVSCASAPRLRSGQHPEAFRKTLVREVGFPYLLFLPRDFDSRPLWPMMLFLHGSGERGNDIEAVKRNGPPKIVESRPDFPFILVSPQCPKNESWDVSALLALLDDLTARLPVDRDRVYVTGLSMGGYGTWTLAVAAPDRFAAIAPVSGGGDSDAACVLRGLPVWAFHGAKDPVVPIKEDQEMVDALRACGGDVKFTVYPDAGHDAWTRAYEDPALYDWLLAHHRVAR